VILRVKNGSLQPHFHPRKYKDNATKVSIKRIDGDDVSLCDDVVVEEIPLVIMVDGVRLTTVLCSPDNLEYLVLGHLLTCGRISGLGDITSFSLDFDRGEATARVQLKEKTRQHALEQTATPACIQCESHLSTLLSCRCNTSLLKIEAAELSALMADFAARSHLFQATGGAHSAALCTRNEIVLMHEDIGRHNTIDKLAGEAASRSILLQDKVLLTSGRISSEILLKAARCDIPLIAGRSAPTALAVESAKRLHITLAGFVRGRRINVYSSFERIITASG
jgi:FdhD protein